jgi:hypothetical protein
MTRDLAPDPVRCGTCMTEAEAHIERAPDGSVERMTWHCPECKVQLLYAYETVGGSIVFRGMTHAPS